mmetsp:Transcript_23824/g.60167  ORF Transcript_23824/g.60167 Transcript_23824/m.60167 type:complete len:854 (-) Transcript_23824:360-2921(-)
MSLFRSAVALLLFSFAACMLADGGEGDKGSRTADMSELTQVELDELLVDTAQILAEERREAERARRERLEKRMPDMVGASLSEGIGISVSTGMSYEDIFALSLPDYKGEYEILRGGGTPVVGNSMWKDVMDAKKLSAEQLERAAFNNFEALKDIFDEKHPEAAKQASRLAGLYLDHFRLPHSAVVYIDSVNASLGSAIEKRRGRVDAVEFAMLEKERAMVLLRRSEALREMGNNAEAMEACKEARQLWAKHSLTSKQLKAEKRKEEKSVTVAADGGGKGKGEEEEEAKSELVVAKATQRTFDILHYRLSAEEGALAIASGRAMAGSSKGVNGEKGIEDVPAVRKLKAAVTGLVSAGYSREAAAVELNLCRLFRTAGRVARAKYYCAQSEHHLQVVGKRGIDNGLRHRLLRETAALDIVEGKPSSAIRKLKGSEKELEAYYGKYHADIVETVSIQAQAYLQMGDFHSAVGGFREGLHRARMSLGPQSRSTLALTANLAAALISRGDSDLMEAEFLLRDVRERQEATLGEKHIDITRTLALEAALMTKKGNHSAAVQMFHAVADDLRSVYGPYHTDVLMTEDNILSSLMSKLGVQSMETSYRGDNETTLYADISGEGKEDVRKAIERQVKSTSKKLKKLDKHRADLEMGKGSTNLPLLSAVLSGRLWSHTELALGFVSFSRGDLGKAEKHSNLAIEALAPAVPWGHSDWSKPRLLQLSLLRHAANQSEVKWTRLGKDEAFVKERLRPYLSREVDLLKSMLDEGGIIQQSRRDKQIRLRLGILHKQLGDLRTAAAYLGGLTGGHEGLDWNELFAQAYEELYYIYTELEDDHRANSARERLKLMRRSKQANSGTRSP